MLAIATTASYLSTVIAAGVLISGGIRSSSELVATYLFFSFSVISTLHLSAFGCMRWFDFRPSKRATKIVEYASIAVIAASLAEIVTFAPSYYLYLKSTHRSEGETLRQISTISRSETDRYCGKGRITYFGHSITTVVYYSTDYCQKLARLKMSDSDPELVLQASKDKKFLSYTPALTSVVPPGGDPEYDTIQNPINAPIAEFATLNTFKLYAEDETSKAVLKWISMLLLPLGIGLSLLKTSLELYLDY